MIWGFKKILLSNIIPLMEQKYLNYTNVRKVVIIGTGFVGAASAFSLMQSGLFSEMVLIDADKERAEG